MNKISLMMIALLSIGLLVLAGCSSDSSGSVPRAPPAPSGGGCGIGAPADVAPDIAATVDAVDGNAGF